MLRVGSHKNKIIVFGIVLIIIFSILFTAMEKNIYFNQYMSNAEIQYSKEYLEWEKLSEEERKNTLKPREEYIPLDEKYRKVIISNNTQKTQGYIYKSSQVPASYNLKDKIGDIKIENQMPYNTCYAYAALNAVETNLALRTGNMYDFSEMHVEYMTSTLFGGTRQLESGGNFGTVTSYLGKGYGPVLESDVPTKTYNEEEYSILTSAVQIARATYARSFSTIDKKNEDYTEDELETVRNEIKNHIMNDSSIFAGLYMSETSNYYNSETYAYCCLDGNMQMNHAVSIVGWDDNYPKENFPEQNRPSKNGAYIAINSWGENWGDSGYFYISYEDVWIEYNMSGIVETEEIGPEIQFSGYSKTSNKISVDVDVIDTGKSGVDETGLKYIWKKSGEVPSKTEFTNSFENGERISIDTSEDLRLWVLAKNNKGVTTIKKEETTLVAGPWDISATENDNVIANFYSDGTLAISGMGSMQGYKSQHDIPWYELKKQISVAIIEEGIENIGSIAFIDASMTSVEISSTVEELNSDIFTRCYQLEEINVNKNNRVFNSIDGVLLDKENTKIISYPANKKGETYQIADTIIEIGSSCFKDSKNIKRMEIPQNVQKIGTWSFQNSAIEEIKILEGCKEISTWAFSNCTNLENIELPNTLKVLSGGAFKDCKKIMNISIPEGITTIQGYTFGGCISLTNIILPESLNKIEEQAFQGCTKLSNIYITSNVNTIGRGAFGGCENLAEINVDENNLYFSNDDGVLFNREKTKLLFYPPKKEVAEYTVPNTVKNIDWYAFSKAENLEIVKLPEGLEEIGYYAFSECKNLISVNMPKTLLKVGGSAFKDCISIKEGEIKNGVTYGDDIFSGCINLTKVTIDNGVTLIPHRTFYNCTSLSEVKLPDTLEEIGVRAYSGCEKLTQIRIPDSVTKIQTYAFAECLSLEEIILSSNLKEIGLNAFENCVSLHEIVIPEGIETLGYSCFAKCSALTSITLPESVLKLEDGYIFIYCTALKSVNILGNIEEIPDGTFAYCTSLEQINIPNSVKKIGEGAFYGCSNLKTIIIPEGVECLGKGPFYECTSLENVTLPTTLRDTGEFTFAKCLSLKNITIPEGVTKIGYASFDGCTSLENVKLPNSLKLIGESAFGMCSNLKEISVSEGVETLEKSVFSYCTNLEKVDLPSTLKEIGEACFYECQNLKKISIPKNIQILNKGTFYQCINLSQIIIPDTVTTIDEYNFVGSKNLTIHCKDGSIAHKYAVDNNINYVLMTDECINHVEIIDEAKNATCTEKGLTEGKHCSLCNEILIAQEEIPALGHDYQSEVTAPTCTEKGYTTHTCSRCQDTYIDTYTDELNHSFTNYVSNNDATCEVNGTETAKCDRCDKTDTRTEVESALGHNYESTVTDPTCTEKGYTTHICSRCQDTYKDEETNALDHSFTNYVSNNDATCEEDGTETAKCDRCEETHTRTDVGSALGHNYESTVTEPTCTEKGYTTHICSRCQDTKVDTYIDKLGHSFTNYVSNNDATCEVNGTETSKCDRCEETHTRTEEESALGHNYESIVTNPTCTEKGYTTHICSRCQDTYIDTYTDTVEHNYENGMCTNCGEKEPTLEIVTEKYNIQDSYITKIQAKTIVKEMKENMQTNATEINVYNKKNELQSDTSKLATGMIVEFKFNNKTYTYTIVVSGDINGDGEAKFSDMVILNRHRLKKRTLEGAYLLSADVTGDGKVDFKDLVKINRFRLKKIKEL